MNSVEPDFSAPSVRSEISVEFPLADHDAVFIPLLLLRSQVHVIGVVAQGFFREGARFELIEGFLK